MSVELRIAYYCRAQHVHLIEVSNRSRKTRKGFLVEIDLRHAPGRYMAYGTRSLFLCAGQWRRYDRGSDCNSQV